MIRPRGAKKQLALEVGCSLNLVRLVLTGKVKHSAFEAIIVLKGSEKVRTYKEQQRSLAEKRIEFATEELQAAKAFASRLAA